MRVIRILLFACMFALCMVMGIAPVIPKRKEPFAMEAVMEETENNIESEKEINNYHADS